MNGLLANYIEKKCAAGLPELDEGDAPPPGISGSKRISDGDISHTCWKT